MKVLNIADACICCASMVLDSSPAVLMPFVAKRVLGHDPVEVTKHWGLRDLRQGMAYSLCHSLQCQVCGTLFLDYRFASDQMASLYRGYRDAAYTQQRDYYEPGYADTVAGDYLTRHSYIDQVEAWLAPHLTKNPSVLDWGGGDGRNTPFLGRGQVLVHDISGAEVVDGAETFDLRQLGSRKFDLVVCSQVLEHVPAPMELLTEILPAMSPRTLLYLEVPHEQLIREHPGSLGLAVLKRHWHEHINFFTEAGLRRLIDRAGLQLVDVHFPGIELGMRQGEVMGLLAKLQIK